MSCSICKGVSDLFCASITEKDFKTYSPDQLTNWLCIECRCKRPKFDNTHTPVRDNRGINSVIHPTIPLDDRNQNVTLRPSNKSDGSLKTSTSSLPPENQFPETIRKIVAEELTRQLVALEQHLTTIFSNNHRALHDNFTELYSRMDTLEYGLTNCRVDIAKTLEKPPCDQSGLEVLSGVTIIERKLDTAPTKTGWDSKHLTDATVMQSSSIKKAGNSSHDTAYVPSLRSPLLIESVPNKGVSSSVRLATITNSRPDVAGTSRPQPAHQRKKPNATTTKSRTNVQVKKVVTSAAPPTTQALPPTSNRITSLPPDTAVNDEEESISDDLVKGPAPSSCPASKARDDDKWTEVTGKRPRKSDPNVSRGTAAPGSTGLEASERLQYLHLCYVKQGTTEDMVLDHLKTICGDDQCTAQLLKSRGNYASFKLSVPMKWSQSVLAPENWTQDICVKPWKRLFRDKGEGQQAD